MLGNAEAQSNIWNHAPDMNNLNTESSYRLPSFGLMSSATSSPASQPYSSPTPSQSEERLAQPFQQRKMASTGGGRAWSEEEENYLIETRQHKMPYKHIAAYLQKTELACRLHYHQLSFGTKRRRRNSSVSSARSSGSNLSANDIPAMSQQRPLPALSPPASPENTPRNGTRSSSPSNPVPIIPKPIAGPQHMIQPGNGLRLITQDIEPRPADEYSRINKERLARIYDAHRGHFWATIARDYGDNVSPAVLEEVWRRGYSGNFPPTPPNRSPSSDKPVLPPAFTDGPPVNSFQPINLPPPNTIAPINPPSRPCGSFAISSLLTEDKEVRRSLCSGN